ncbi:MAG: lysine--tRNA ligase [Candidatus Cloacimonetes bacterium]|nr:lysine--tRNA ligase [Candidatus Cloacimonadota bacterium]
MDNQNQLIQARQQKMQRLLDMGVNPYPNRSSRSHIIKDLWDNQQKFTDDEQKVTITGRIIALRRQGKVGFGNVADESGNIQIFVRKDNVGEENYEIFKSFDLGDFCQIEGSCFVTQMGEYSVRATCVTMLAKAVRPLPVVKEKVVDGKTIRFDEFHDIELRYRKRYLDLLLNPEHKHAFELRAHIISGMRRFFENRGFLEVETPILTPLYGGAHARPFNTHHNTLDMELYLRISIELYLKRLIIGGFEKVYEIGKVFRNEGMDRAHNPEFTLLELYQAYTDLDGMIELTESLFKFLAKEVLNTDTVTFHNTEINLTAPFRKASMLELIKEYSGFDASDFDYDKIKTFCLEHHIEVTSAAGAGKLIEEIFNHFVEPKLLQPTFVIDYPREISPLAKAKPDDPNLVERFELFIMGNEYANAFTELNDPHDQRKRLEDQQKMREMGDAEANVIDEDFLEALEYGMPPMGGIGIGIDRLIMLLTDNTSIKEVILFPQMKPEN